MIVTTTETVAPSFTRSEAIDAAATVARTLGDTLRRHQTREIESGMLAAACLAATITDALVATVEVVDSPGQSHAGTLARSTVEAFVDFELLCLDAGNLKHLRLNAARGTIKTLSAWLRHHDDAPADAERVTRTHREMADAQDLIDELKAEGAQQLRMAEKFATLGPAFAQFETFWLHFCTSAHNDLSALASRHLRIDHKLTIGETLTDEQAIEILAICSTVALQVYSRLPLFMDVTPEQLAPEWQPIVPLIQRFRY